MAITEALRLVVDADTRGAVQGIERLGHTAERELSRSEQSLDRWGNRLTNVGASLIGIGSVALVGLGAAAMASEEANLATVKLENSLKNMPKLAGESSQQFLDLAASIQDVTAADADAIVEAEALLATFNLTADEIESITPLVVDLARKFDLDMASAATQVGKALDGNSGALKRNGISIDETLFATDRYAAVQKALSDQVGGFAEAEGATFAGSLQRLRNELGDLAEGVGVGAVDAFSSMFGVVDGLTGRLNDLSPATQETVGKFATFASVGLIAAGGASILIGQIIKMRDNFVIAREAVASFAGAGGLGRLARAGLVIGGLIALREVVMALDDDLKGIDVSTLENELLDLAQTGRLSGEQLKTAFAGIGDAFDAGDPQKIEAAADQLGEVDKALAQLAGRDPGEAAAAFREIRQALLDVGLTSDQVKQFFNDYAAAVSNADTASRTGAGGVEAVGGAMSGQAGSTEEATSALQEYSNALQAQFDPLFGAVNASQQLAEANQKVVEAEVAVAEAVRDHGEGSAEATAAQQALTLAQLDTTSAALTQESAMIELSDAVGNGTVSLQGAKDKLAEWVAQGLITQASADVTAAKFDEVTGSALAVPGTVSTDVSAPGAIGSRIEIEGVGRALNEIPSSHNSHVTTSGTQTAVGELDAVARRINSLSGANVRVSVGGGGGLILHEGGVVPGPRGQEVAAILQAGERVISLPEMDSMHRGIPAGSLAGGGGGGLVVNYTVNVNGGLDSAASIGQSVVEKIQAYERSNGTVWRN